MQKITWKSRQINIVCYSGILRKSRFGYQERNPVFQRLTVYKNKVVVWKLEEKELARRLGNKMSLWLPKRHHKKPFWLRMFSKTQLDRRNNDYMDPEKWKSKVVFWNISAKNLEIAFVKRIRLKVTEIQQNLRLFKLP